MLISSEPRKPATSLGSRAHEKSVRDQVITEGQPLVPPVSSRSLFEWKNGKVSLLSAYGLFPSDTQNTHYTFGGHGGRKQDPTQSTKKKRFYHETNEAEASGHLAFLSPSQDQGMCSHGHCFPTFTEVKYFKHS